MPNKKHPPRGGAPNKPVYDPSEPVIEFTNATGDSRKSRKNKVEAESNEPAAKGKGKAVGSNGEAAQDGPKKPDTRTLIGGASWTGKLPVNMLSEHCQKQKWDKPEYTMIKVGQGYVSTVILKTTNTRTRERNALSPFCLPMGHRELAVQPTALEARHFAATYTLFRIASMKNIHMMMPPTCRDLWKGAFQEIKKEEENAGRGWTFAADPFAMLEEREREKAKSEKQRLEREKERARREKEQGPSIVLPGSSGADGAVVQNPMKGWTKAPRIEMGKRTRQMVEKLIRNSVLWNAHGVVIDFKSQSVMVQDISALGFRASHVEEAVDACKDKQEVLEWLLIHVPEDDLPKWALPDNYTAGVSMASGDLKREAVLQRLASAGYAMELCEEMLDSVAGDEAKAAAALQSYLLQDGTSSNVVDELSALAIEESEAVWDQEQCTLDAIYGDRFACASDGSFAISLDPQGDSLPPMTLKLRRPPGQYPAVPPTLTLDAKLPAYIRLSMIKRALNYAKEAFVNEPMVFNIVDWLEINAESIIENPGRLSAVSVAVGGVSEGNSGQSASSTPKAQTSKKAGTRRANGPSSAQLLASFQAKDRTPAFQAMLRARQGLPAWRLQDAIVSSVSRNPVTIISGETGSGKSTQSVQFILDDIIARGHGGAANIICTQPRRISAMGLADRVADERCSRVGDEVGYSIRGESKVKPGTTKITFVTTGVLLRRLQTSGGKQEDVARALEDVSHVVVDEVHERSLDTDFLLVLLRDVLRVKKDLKVILMSATLDAQAFESYFAKVGTVGKVEIQGRTHPVLDYWLEEVRDMVGGAANDGDEDGDDSYASHNNHRKPQSSGDGSGSSSWRIDYDLIAKTVRCIDSQLGSKDGGILIFLPGTAEIDRTMRALQQQANLYTLPLHASLLPADQRRVFPPAPHGKRKVVCATNVAETSITIPDIVAVIDTGRVKETAYDAASNMVRLSETWASRAACKQRRGRAGRVREGTCYKLYTRATEERTMMERPEPEIRRVPLEQLVLSVKSMGIPDVPRFLAGALTPPDAGAVNGAVELLTRMGALESNELTSLGRHLASIPADLRCAKLMVYGAVFGCLDACLTIASVLTARSPFVSPPNIRNESKALRAKFGGGSGDLIADLRAYDQWQSMRERGIMARDIRAWVAQNYLSGQTLNDISSNRGQYLSSLKETGFLPLGYRFAGSSGQQSLNSHNGNDALLRALIAASFTPQIARIEFPEKKFAAGISGAVELDPEAKTIKYFNQENGRVFVHPGSTVFDAQGFPEGCAFMAYFTKMATSKVFIRELTPFNAYALLLFGGPIALDTLGRGLLVDGWVRLRGWARIGVLVSRLRMMLDELLAKKIDDPGMDLGASEVVGVVRKLVELNGLDR